MLTNDRASAWLTATWIAASVALSSPRAFRSISRIVTRWNNCSAGFPFCVAGGLGLPSVEYTEYYARSVDLFAERAGPLSLLPASENQKTVIKWNTSEGAVQ